MKKAIILAAAALIAVACDKTENTQKEYKLEAKPVSLVFEATGNEPATVEITAVNVEWDTTVDETATAWLTAVKDGDSTLKVTAADNTEEAERTATLRIADKNGNAQPVSISVRQAGVTAPPSAGSITVDKSELSFGWEGGTSQTFTVTVTGEDFTWKASADITSAGWLHAETDGNTVTVTADENTSDEPRSGKINVRPSDETVESVSVAVTQEGCDRQPSLTVDKTELHFKAIDKEPQVISVQTVRIPEWNIQIGQPAETPMLNVTTDKEKGTITVEAIRNISTAPRTGTITVQTGGIVADIVINVTQDGSDSDATSTLTDDVELTAENLAVSKIAVSSDQLEEMTQTSWHLEIHDETCYRNPNTGWLTGTGTFLTLELVNARPTDYSFLPDGTYTVDGEPTTDPETGSRGRQVHTSGILRGKFFRPVRRGDGNGRHRNLRRNGNRFARRRCLHAGLRPEGRCRKYHFRNIYGNNHRIRRAVSKHTVAARYEAE